MSSLEGAFPHLGSQKDTLLFIQALRHHNGRPGPSCGLVGASLTIART